jgi:DNA-binding MarR family transcriptional regulator
MLRKTPAWLTIDSWKVNKADINFVANPDHTGRKGQTMANRNAPKALGSGESLLFLTDDQLRRGIEAMFFAYRGFTADPDRILQEYGYGRAHHRAIHFINRSPGTTVNNLLSILGVTKQSLNRVLRTLVEDGLVESRVGARDKRERHLYLTESGAALERALSEAQRNRMRDAFRAAGPEAVSGFRAVLEQMMDPDMKRHYLDGGEGKP